MATWIYSYVIYMLVISSSLGTRCPLNVNDKVNITRIVNVTVMTWYRNNVQFTGAAFKASTGTCGAPSNSANYTIYCEARGKFTLEVHHPVDGDRYSDTKPAIITTTIIFQEPANISLVITPRLNTNITLFDNATYILTTTVNCTKPTPVLKWIVRPKSGTPLTINGESTNNTTGCDVKQTTITSRITLSRQTVNLFNQPFQVLSQLSYVECDNIHTSLPGIYFTITDSPKITKLTTGQLNNVVDEGADVMFTCSVDSFLPPSIIWTRSQQGGQLYSGAQYTLPVTCQHTDNYTCSANITVDKVVSRSVPLYVRCSPRAITPTPCIITNTNDTNVTLHVVVIAYPAPTFTWYHRGTNQNFTTAVTQQLTINQYQSTLIITLNASLFYDYVVSVVNDVGKVNFTFALTEGDHLTTTEPTTPGPIDDNSILIAVGAAAGVLVVLIIGIIICICVYRKLKKGKKKTKADSPSTRAQPQDSDTEVYFDNLDYVGSDDIFGPRTGTPATGIFGGGNDGGNSATRTSKHRTTSKTVYDDNVAYLGSDDIFGPRTGTNGTTNNTPAQSQETTQGQIYAQVDRTKKRPAASKKPAQQKQKPVSTSRGLNYTQVDFTNTRPATSKKPAKPKVERVEYAGIQHGVKGHIQRPDVYDDDDDDE